jgi:lactoylglutathione lyase
LFDLGLLTNRRDAMLGFWRDEMGLPVERELRPVDGVVQYKLTLRGAVLKINCCDTPLPARAAMTGIRMLLLADPSVSRPRHMQDPDGNLVCLVPPGYKGITTFGVHFAVCDEVAFAHFFGTILGLRKIADRMFDFAGATLSFAWSPDAVADSPDPGTQSGTESGTGYRYLTFQVMDVAAAHEEVCGRGASEIRAPSSKHTNTSSTISFIADPDGNMIEISQRPDLVDAALRQGLQCNVP